MLKYAALLFNTIALLIYQFFFAEGITVTQNVPSSAKPDSEFTVELIINKGTIGGFAKLQQDLPEGFTAIQDDNNGASFTFTNQSVKFIWMSLPNDKEFKIKYKVKVAGGISGEKVIAGKFSYVSDNVKQSIEIAPAKIIIGDASQPIATTPTTTEPTTTTAVTPATTTEPTTTTEPVATTPTTTAASGSEASSLTCIRTIPANATDNFTVEIVINKGNVSGFAKLLETLPAGFTATAGETQGSSFSFADQKVKFVWVSMPSQTEFKISYKVSVAAGISGTHTIDGVFSYIENDETKKYTLPAGSILISPGSTPVTATTTEPTTTTEPATTAITEPVTTTTTSATTTTTDKSIAATTIPAPEGNVNYRVQIMALHNAVDANSLATRYNINMKVNTEMTEGFTKYTVGSHNEYKEARDAREDIRNKGVAGPFVTAYSSGKRITVQEALMITSQKWFR